MESNVTKSLHLVDLMWKLGLLDASTNLPALRRSVEEISRRIERPCSVFCVLQEAFVPHITVDNKLSRLEYFTQGDFAHYVQALAGISKGTVEFKDVGDDLWQKPGGRHPEILEPDEPTETKFRVWFCFRDNRYQAEFIQKWDESPPDYAISRLVNTALKDAGVKERFVCIMDIHLEDACTIFADPTALKALQNEGLIGRLPKVTEDYL